MTVIRTTRIVGALGAVALGAALLPGAIAAGTDSAPVIEGGGVLLLHLGNDGDNVQFLPPTGSGQPTVQDITSKKCVATPPPLLSLMPQPSPPAGAIGLVDHSLGVKAGNDGTGTPCGRVDGLSQALSLSLGGPLAGNLIEFAELDIEGKFGVTVLAEAYQGSNLVGTDRLDTGPGSDSGPDSGDGDNFRWRPFEPSVPFDRLVLSVDDSTPGGSFSLEGGADGTTPEPGGLGAALGTSDSVFQLGFTGVLDCGQTAPTVGGDGTPAATLTRGQNDGCQTIPYLLRTDKNGAAQSVLLQKLLGDQADANFTMTIVWEPEPAENPLPPTTIDYDGPGPNPPAPVVWCGGTTASPIPVPGQAWCLTSQHLVLAGGGNVQMTEGYFGSGDPVWIR
jgi:hypothetical protein